MAESLRFVITYSNPVMFIYRHEITKGLPFWSRAESEVSFFAFVCFVAEKISSPLVNLVACKRAFAERANPLVHI